MRFHTYRGSVGERYVLLHASDETIRSDYHTHSTVSDGTNTPEEMVEEAIRKGMVAYGLSDHSHVPDGDRSLMRLDQIRPLQEEMARLKEKYKGRIELYCGVEQDYCSDASTDGFDYVIGSVHEIEIGGAYYHMGGNAEKMHSLADRFFGGDVYALIEKYYEMVSEIVEVTHCDLIGHFDHIAKKNLFQSSFDENHPRYVRAWQKAADRLLSYGIPFEVNTSSYRDGRMTPMPAHPILLYLLDRGAEVVLSSDAHSKNLIGLDFDKFVTL